MAVKVLITRRFKKGKERDFFELLNQMRGRAVESRGYISGQTLVGLDDPQRVVVVSTWHSVDHWLNWQRGEIRTAIDSQLTDLLETPPNYEVFTLGSFPER